MLPAARLLCVALLVLGSAACNDQKKLDNVAKYCVLTTMPSTTAPELEAIQAKALALFKERRPYKTTDANRAVVDAAEGVATSAGQYALQLRTPELQKGYAKGLGFPKAMAQLKAACAALPTPRS